MRRFKYIFLFSVLTLGMASCEKHEIEYMSTPVEKGMAEIQLHYFVPVTAVAGNNIYKMEIGGQEYVNNGAAVISTYNATPSGNVGRFYVVKAGDVNIKLYQSNKQQLVYDKNITLGVGKQNVFVYDFDKEPIVFDNGYPYETNTTMDTDSTCWVKFYHFMYEKEGEYCPLKLQYQYQYTISKDVKSDWINIGGPIGFGETTGWQPVKIKKNVFNSEGYTRIDYKIKVQDANGEYTEELQVWNSKSKYIPYSDYWNGYIGRRYHHILKGMRSAKPIASVSQFIAL
ncbi:hypothetical protein JN06_02147 [Bacteroides zoogleoformans]|uniref:DUF4595 domain-containing protein n=2 Tax=Bacteroides zoogleoformans TaxID=28119 RepID=A0ABM6T5Z3_9BACE|nr:hypothetical protein C4H11_03590 [Bacteroides zoogleoformans]TWJ13089.1 hypothetical protein JN06_02147 [Bacteroides zoogleoformans]